MNLRKTGLPIWQIFLCWFSFLTSIQAGYHIVPIHELDVPGDKSAWEEALEKPVGRPKYGWKTSVRTNAAAWLAPKTNDQVSSTSDISRSVQHDLYLAVHAPDGGVIEGFVDLMISFDETKTFPFTLDTSLFPDVGEAGIREIQNAHYARLAQASLPGTAWFRHQAGQIPSEEQSGSRSQDFDSTFAMFTGSRAIAENLALDRELILDNEVDETARIPLSGISGIRVRSIDWTGQLISCDEQVVDALSMAIPSDQHALFSPSMDSFLDLTNWIQKEGLPIAQSFAYFNPYQSLIQRYREQLGLDLPDMIARQFKVRGVAVTGGDPYLPSGTDVAVVFDPVDPKVFHELLLTTIRIKAVAKQATTDNVTGDGWQAESYVTPDRSFSCHITQIGRYVVVANSAAQIRKLASVAAGKDKALGSLDEFRFFRQRYPSQADETGFLFISDQTIRRWCGPESRIGASRRARATAALLDLTTSSIEGSPLQDTYKTILGKVSCSSGKVISEVHGSLGFLTPISELGIVTASEREKTAYETWRTGYETGWPVKFDPIAIRFTAADKNRGMDLSIIPLTAGSDYEELINLAGKAHLSERSRSVPDGASFFLSLAVDHDAKMFRDFHQQIVGFMPELKIDPLAWMGESVSFWLDDIHLAAAFPDYLSDFGTPPPAVLRIESKSAVKLAMFISATRAFIEQSAPGLLKWETRTFGKHSYVVIDEIEEAITDLTVCYATLPNALLVSLNEIALIRAITLENATLQENIPEARHAFAEINPTTLGAFINITGRHAQATREQQVSWAAIPVLNEWIRHHPNQDPVQLHRQWFGTSLLCPGGKGYQWNEKAMTMESATYGHPSMPRADDPPESPLAKYAALRAGLDFEDDGLRVRASAGDTEAHIPIVFLNKGDLIGRAEDYFPNDPGLHLVYEYETFDNENEDGNNKVRKAVTETLLKPEDGSFIRVIKGAEGSEEWESHFSLENGLEHISWNSQDGGYEYENNGMIELPSELRAGAIHEVFGVESGHFGEESFRTFHRSIIRIIGVEPIETPAGKFDQALHVETTNFRFSRSINQGYTHSDSSTDTFWYVKGLGKVKTVAHLEGEPFTTQLITITSENPPFEDQ